MTHLTIVYAPDPIFKLKAIAVSNVDDNIRSIVDSMKDAMYREGAVGLGANMLGILKRIAVVDLQENGARSPYVFINPEITWRSDELQTFAESSLSFPGIFADITRAKAIKVSYLDYNGEQQELKAEGFFAQVIQHEIDYLDGKVFLDYLSAMKREMLIKKMIKHIKNPPHVHSEHCNH